MNKNTGILVLGHGSTRPHNKEIVESVAKMISDGKDVIVRTAFMNVNEPSIKDGLASFSGTGVETIVALPIFLAHGVHTLEDIPGELNLDDGGTATIDVDGNAVEIVYAEPLGIDPCIAELAYRRAEEALSR